MCVLSNVFSLKSPPHCLHSAAVGHPFIPSLQGALDRWIYDRFGRPSSSLGHRKSSKQGQVTGVSVPHPLAAALCWQMPHPLALFGLPHEVSSGAHRPRLQKALLFSTCPSSLAAFHGCGFRLGAALASGFSSRARAGEVGARPAPCPGASCR